jgi:hypothetical protein
MVVEERHEPLLIEALRHLGEAQSLVDQISGEIGYGGKRLLQNALIGAAKRISLTRRELAKFVPRRPDQPSPSPPERAP